MRDHRKLRAFELADRLVLEVYQATRAFPPDERWGLVSQLRRAVVSVPANIVEGSARNSEKEYLHFLGQALGSLREVGYLLDLSRRLGFMDASVAQGLESQYQDSAATLAALIRSLRQRSSQADGG